MKKKDDMVLAIAKEIQMRKNEYENEIIEYRIFLDFILKMQKVVRKN